MFTPMAYAFERGETVSAGVLRIMQEQLARVEEHLGDESLPHGKRVHETRKRFKEIRALLRLVRKPLGRHFAAENAWYRDHARDLAGTRDADAAQETLAKLSLPKLTERRIRKLLATDGTATRDPALLIATLLPQIGEAKARTSTWPDSGDGFETIAAGLARSYRGGRREARRALSSRDAEGMHEWRKRVKDHWYHVQLMRNVWPAMMKPYAAVLSDLSRDLGDHHDIHVLSQKVESAPARFRAAARARQEQLERDAAAVAARIYAERTEAWLARMRNLWNAWRTN